MMTTKRLLLAGILPLCFVTACAGDPNKNANDAHAADLKSDRKEEQNTADQRSDQKVSEAEAQRKATVANAGGNSAQQGVVGADAKFTEVRTTYRAKATERLEKADARTSELRQLIDRAGAKATTSSRDALQTVSTQRDLVTREIDGLPSVSNDAWKNAERSLDIQLSTLEGLVKKTADEVGKFKK